MKDNLKYVIILVVLLGLGLLGWNWHNDIVESKVRETIALKEGEKKELLRQDSINNIIIASLKHTIDSAKAKLNQADTIPLYHEHTKIINAVRDLGADATIDFFAKQVSK